MTDPTEAALRAVENKYYRDVVEGKSLMPFYPRADVDVMVSAAVAAERASLEPFVRSVAEAHLDLYGDDARTALLKIQRQAKAALRNRKE